jgi:endonuclease/exonuclease/phosphatase family metal-dependent hydrolase
MPRVLTQRLLVAALTAIVVTTACAAPETASDAAGPAPATLRVATFNIFELGISKLDARDSLGAPTDSQVLAAAEILRDVRPDIVLLNEIDAVPGDPALAARRFAAEFLATGPDSLIYPYVYSAETNTGALSGFDLNRDGVVATAADVGTRTHGDDSWGYGTYPGQYGMAILSRYPIDTAAVRSFRMFLWKDLQNAHLPVGWYSDAALEQFRLSSKSHWDVPIVIGTDTLHLLASHPTPPVFDGDEDRNGRRNYDEVGFWSHYLDSGTAIRDDRGVAGGLAAGAAFVILGDLNAPPDQVESHYGSGPDESGPAIMQLLRDPRIQDPVAITGRPTAFFNAGTRADYVLPSATLRVLGGDVVWPDSTLQPAAARRAAIASDHRLVWLDLALPFSAPKR